MATTTATLPAKMDEKRPPSASRSPLLRLARVLGWLGLVGLACFLLAMERSPATEMAGVRKQAGLVYGQGVRGPLRLDLYTPDGPSPPHGWPVVIAIHGGGWRGGSRQEFGRQMAPLARQGIAVAAIDYTLARPGRPAWPSNLEDARKAVRWVRAQAGLYGLDPGRIAALGASAGGHLAALLGTDAADTSSRVRAVISLYGPSHLPTLSAPCLAPGGPVHWLLGSPASVRPDLAERASPLAHVSNDDAPILLVHGTDDPLVPPDQSSRLADAIRRAGVSGVFIPIPGGVHGFGLVSGTHDVERDVLEFLDRTWNDDNRSEEPGPAARP
jgi:acetyl esterase/lipase